MSRTEFQAKLTQAGLLAVMTADGAGVALKVVSIGLGSGNNNAGYNPTGAELALVNEVSRVPIIEGSVIGPGQFSIHAHDDSLKVYELHEVGFYLEDGTLLALYSNPTEMITYKNQGTLLVDLDLILDAVPAGTVTIDVTGDLQLVYTTEFVVFGTALTRVYKFLIDAWVRELDLRKRLSLLVRQNSQAFNYIRYGPAERVELSYDPQSRIRDVQEHVAGAIRASSFTYVEDRIQTVVLTIPVLEIEETSTFLYDTSGRITTIITSGVQT